MEQGYRSPSLSARLKRDGGLKMSLSSSLTALARSLALLTLLVAALLFALFALSPAMDLLPGGLDGPVAILFALLLVVWAISAFRRRKHP